MSISISPMSSGESVPNRPQQNLKIAPAVTISVPGESPTARSATNAKEGDAVKPSTEQTQQSLQEINKVLAALSISVQFQIDPSYKEVIIKVVDQDTGKVIRQIPSEDVVRMSKVVDTLKGMLFSQAV